MWVFLEENAMLLTFADTWGSLTTPTLHHDTWLTTLVPTPDTTTLEP